MKFNMPFPLMWKSTFLDIPLTLMSESLRFAGTRMQAQGEYLATLISCRSVPEVVETQSEFVRKAVDDYGAESGKIMEDLRANVSKAA
jgi:hypothetical protein